MKALKALATAWKTNPKVRVGARVVAVAIAGYAVASIKEGVTDWRSLAGGAAMAGIYAVAGLLTPIEPKVGIKTTVTDKPPA